MILAAVIAAVWMTVATALGLYIGRAIRTADRALEGAWDADQAQAAWDDAAWLADCPREPRRRSDSDELLRRCEEMWAR